MFETMEFRNQLTEAVADQTARSGLSEYQLLIVTLLQSLAQNNEPRLMESEMRKMAYARQGVPQALSNATELVKHAATFALKDDRSLLTVNDILDAHRARFCNVWPFCR